MGQTSRRSSQDSQQRNYFLLTQLAFILLLTVAMLSSGAFGLLPDNPVTGLYRQVFFDLFPAPFFAPGERFLSLFTGAQTPEGQNPSATPRQAPLFDPAGLILQPIGLAPSPAADNPGTSPVIAPAALLLGAIGLNAPEVQPDPEVGPDPAEFLLTFVGLNPGDQTASPVIFDPVDGFVGAIGLPIPNASLTDPSFDPAALILRGIAPQVNPDPNSTSTPRFVFDPAKLLFDYLLPPGTLPPAGETTLNPVLDPAGSLLNFFAPPPNTGGPTARLLPTPEAQNSMLATQVSVTLTEVALSNAATSTAAYLAANPSAAATLEAQEALIATQVSVILTEVEMSNAATATAAYLAANPNAAATFDAQEALIATQASVILTDLARGNAATATAAYLAANPGAALSATAAVASTSTSMTATASAAQIKTPTPTNTPAYYYYPSPTPTKKPPAQALTTVPMPTTAPTTPPSTPPPVTYTVSFNANGAVSGTAPANQTKVQLVALTLATNSGGLALTGSTFNGWNTQPDGSGTHYAAGGAYTTDAALTLYAEWTVGCLSAITVSNANDSGAGSLRQAMLDLCTGGTITFDNNYVITLASQLPAVTTVMTITGNGAANTVIQAAASPGVATYIVFAVGPAGNLTLNGASVQNGVAPIYGGGIVNRGTLAVTNSTFSGNTAQIGGGICNFGGTLTVDLSVFSGNSASNNGGGIMSSGTAIVSNSEFSGNNAPGGAGLSNQGTMTVTKSTFSNNAASHVGGGIDNLLGTLTVSNSTFSGNTATSSGGGILSQATLTVTNSTFSGNSAPTGGGLFHTIDTLYLYNTILANSLSGGDCANGGGAVAANTNNLIEDGSCSPAFSGDPLLGPLGWNGGSTQTFALLAGSPAIDTGDAASCPATDQRGIARPQGAQCDIGAYEFP